MHLLPQSFVFQATRSSSQGLSDFGRRWTSLRWKRKQPPCLILEVLTSPCALSLFGFCSRIARGTLNSVPKNFGQPVAGIDWQCGIRYSGCSQSPNHPGILQGPFILKKVQRSFAVEYKSGRRKLDSGSSSIWGNLDLKSVARDLEEETTPYLSDASQSGRSESEMSSPKADRVDQIHRR
ncbi:hypothetical protein Rleg9DRAFT_4898 [Rhizobium leguminosarum bv. trifolii WSM597]|uniref:Uncharacterized protein n=1 Tax=Rhizobium leguminosarum bv. trifolii WSM597 TaxID=754764 RepID=J0H780_RHILT|nr:hypothetical protein Rleg9DRAFT_4898 [Rhizobium leguminosarum bv. trifolii WSM597]